VLVGHFGGGVDEFDVSSGAYIKTYAPGGGWQWAGLYAPNGNVYIGSQVTGDVREYDASTAAFVRVVCAFAGPADMDIGPNGHLYVCGYQFGNVGEFDATTGALITTWNLPAGAEANDIAFIPGNGIFVTASRTNMCYRFNNAHVLTGLFSGTGWQRPHGIAISPHTGNILIADGVTTQVHEFDPVTFAELNPAFRQPPTGDKIVDIAFRPDQPVPVRSTTWGRIKGTYR
jgi:DNA-binding beta-propeller fold protein YncE